MSQRQRNLTVLLVACLAGVCALAALAVPPFPILGWFISAVAGPPFESWWSTAVYPLVITLLFWLVSRPLRLGHPRDVRWTVAFTAIAGVASLVWFLLGWKYGLQYQGLSTMIGYLVVSAVWVAVVVVGLRFVSRSGSWWAHLALEFVAFAWVVTLAFPWLGEMISR